MVENWATKRILTERRRLFFEIQVSFRKLYHSYQKEIESIILVKIRIYKPSIKLIRTFNKFKSVTNFPFQIL